MANHNDGYDLVVIGGGSGGVRGARTAAQLGARVVLIEASRLGGTCVNLGCVPKKLLAYGSRFGEALTDMIGYGWTSTGASFDWPTLVAAKDHEIARLNTAYARLLEGAHVEVVAGYAKVTGPNTVVVGDREIRGERLLVATGGRPWRPGPGELPGVEHTLVSDDLFSLPALPERMAIVGGGYIACEFASIFSGLGVAVTLGYRAGQPLRGFDEDVRRVLGVALAERGIALRPNTAPSRIERNGAALRIIWADGSHDDVDSVLMATGRVPNTAGLGLAEQGVALAADGAVIVDASFRTSVPSVWAVGDVISRIALTPVALAEATVFARAQFGGGDGAMDYDAVPSAVFTSPQVGTVGLSEQAAVKRFGADNVAVYESSFRPMLHALTGRARHTFLKVLVERESDRVVGMHIVDGDAGEITQGFAAAIKAGITKRQLDATIGIHPTAAEELVTMRTARAAMTARASDGPRTPRGHAP